MIAQSLCDNWLPYMQKILFSSFLVSSVSRRRSSTRCDAEDFQLLGGGGSGVVNNLESCIPEVVSESNLDQIEACVEMSFIPVSLSQDCNRCSITYLENHELELKSCLMKCSGPARSSNTCQKCKDVIQMSWDDTCSPRSASEEFQAEKSIHTSSLYSLSTYITVIVIYVLVL